MSGPNKDDDAGRDDAEDAADEAAKAAMEDAADDAATNAAGANAELEDSIELEDEDAASAEDDAAGAEDDGKAIDGGEGGADGTGCPFSCRAKKCKTEQKISKRNKHQQQQERNSARKIQSHAKHIARAHNTHQYETETAEITQFWCEFLDEPGHTHLSTHAPRELATSASCRR